MLTTVWGPSLWHYLHILSFNFPIKPTSIQKKKHLEFIKNLQYTLPCKYCRINLRKNFKILKPNKNIVESRETFSRYVYNLHELINSMLNKKSNLTYNDVRQRYEHFRARCTKKILKIKYLKIKLLKKQLKKKKVVQRHIMEKNQNVLLKLSHRKINVILFKWIINV